MTTTHIWLIRHGETQWNAERRLQGWRDIPLNDTGIEQARRLSEHLRSDLFDSNIDAIISSDLLRASQTADLGAGHLGLPVLACPPVRERSYGIYEGQSWAQLNGVRESGQAAIDFRNPHQIIEQGETQDTFEARIIKAFETLALEHRGRNIMVFSHGGVIDVVWRKIMNIAPQAPRLETIFNTSINHFSINDSHWQAIQWGQVEHLQTTALDDIG